MSVLSCPQNLQGHRAAGPNTGAEPRAHKPQSAYVDPSAEWTGLWGPQGPLTSWGTSGPPGRGLEGYLQPHLNTGHEQGLRVGRLRQASLSRGHGALSSQMDISGRCGWSPGTMGAMHRANKVGRKACMGSHQPLPRDVKGRQTPALRTKAVIKNDTISLSRFIHIFTSLLPWLPPRTQQTQTCSRRGRPQGHPFLPTHQQTEAPGAAQPGQTRPGSHPLGRLQQWIQFWPIRKWSTPHQHTHRPQGSPGPRAQGAPGCWSHPGHLLWSPPQHVPLLLKPHLPLPQL